MTKTPKKKRAPIKQLLKAGQIAHKLLVERGIRSKNSKIDAILKDKDAPTLPGIPAYLPRPEYLAEARRICLALLLIWREKNLDNEVKMNSIPEFFKFMIKDLTRYKKDALKEHALIEKNIEDFVQGIKEVPVLGELFSPLQRVEVIDVSIRFFVDSLVVSNMVREKETTGEFFVWFMDYVDQLEKLWNQQDVQKSN
jgi:hypothetical protein